MAHVDALSMSLRCTACEVKLWEAHRGRSPQGQRVASQGVVGSRANSRKIEPGTEPFKEEPWQRFKQESRKS